ncbi:hypothetical protein FB451DRAFT_1561218 [Mycena latifolia]|nr:hypothetical protein FB451DRAFT_1561218 [Mycena latifolia]
MVALAQELVDAIIDELGANNGFENQDYASLHACSLVARAFVAPTQRHLFRRLALTRQNRALNEARAKVAQRSALLSSSPHLATYVRDLTLQIDLFSDVSAPLISLLPLLSSIKRLVIRGGARKWGELPADLRTALVALFFLHGLRCVALDCFSGVPASIIRYALSSFKEVSLTSIYISSDGDLPAAHQLVQTSFPSTAVLDHLVLDYPPDVSTALHALLLGNEITNPFGHLRHLEVTLNSWTYLSAFASIVLKYSHSIQHLAIDFERLPWNALALPSLPRLRILTLKATVGELKTPNSVLMVIASLPSCMPNIEVVNILIYISTGSTYSDFIRLAEVDAALMKLPQLREVHFHVTFSFGSGQITNFESLMRQTLHRASGANLLTFSRSGNWGYKDHFIDVFSN